MKEYPSIRLDKLIDKELNPPHWIWSGAQSNGGRECWARGLDNKPMSARKAVWELLHGKVGPGHIVRSTCGVIKCVSPECTEVRKSKVRGGVVVEPVISGRRFKYTDEQIAQAEELLKDPRNNLKFIERHTGVHFRTVWDLKKKLKKNE